MEEGSDKMARNIEVLSDYYLGRDPQLKETLSDNSLRLIGIEGKHFVLRPELIQKAQELQHNIDVVAGDLVTEATTRSNKDTELNNKFNNYYTKAQTDSIDAGITAKVPYTALTQDIRIYEDNPVIAGLSGTGWYYTGEHVIYYEDSVEPVWNENTIFYYSDDGEDKYAVFLPETMTSGFEILKAIMWWDLDFHQWVADGWWITNTITPESTDNQIPTAAAVAQTLTDNFQIKFVKVLAGDMTLTPDIADGLYYTDTHVVKYNGNTVIPAYTLFSSKNYSLGIAIKTVELQNPTHTTTIGYLTSLGSWSFGEEQYVTSGNLGLTINSSSTYQDAPSSKAVYEFAGEHYSTTERVVGTWIGDKPLYQKVMTGTFPVITAGTNVSVKQVIDTNFENGFIKYAWFKTNNNQIQKMIPYTDSNFYMTSAQIGGGFPLNQLNVQSASDEASEKDFTVVVCYTKTTD